MTNLHPLFSHALRHAARVGLEEGKITQSDHDTIESVVSNPVRKSTGGQTADVVERTRQHAVYMAFNDKNLSTEVRENVDEAGFNWEGIWQWILANLPEILQVIAALISIFILIA
jgi:hypothetical protein